MDVVCRQFSLCCYVATGAGVFHLLRDIHVHPENANIPKPSKSVLIVGSSDAWELVAIWWYWSLNSPWSTFRWPTYSWLKAFDWVHAVKIKHVGSLFWKSDHSIWFSTSGFFCYFAAFYWVVWRSWVESVLHLSTRRTLSTEKFGI